MSSQTIFRVVGPNRSYTKLSNTLLADRKMSLECKGMLVSILMLPVNWTFNVTWLRKEFGIGRDKAYALIREAAECGYCRKEEKRAADGSMSRIEYLFSDDPSAFASDEPLPENPEVDEPLPEKPDTAEATSGKSGSIQRTYRRDKELIVKPPSPLSRGKRSQGSRLPEDWTLPDDWREWARVNCFASDEAIAREAANFADYWIAKPSAATSLDWRRTWQKWCRKSFSQDGNRRPAQTYAKHDEYRAHMAKVRAEMGLEPVGAN